MNKKVIGIIAAVVIVIILAIVAVFALKGKGQDKEQGKVDNSINSIENNEKDKYEGIDIEGLAQKLDMTEDELKEVLDKELDGSAAQAYYNIQAELDATPEIDYIIPESITGDGHYDVVDVNGDIYEVYDPIAAMTTEEREEYNKKMDEVFAAYEDGDDDEAARLSLEASNIIKQANNREPDQELIDAGFVAIKDPTSDTGWRYENPNIVVNEEDRGTTDEPSFREIITDKSQIATGYTGDPYSDPTEVSYGGN